MARLVGFITVLLLAVTTLTNAGIRSFPQLFEHNIELPHYHRPPQRRDELNYRLPNNTLPIHYNVTLTTNVHIGDVAFIGTVRIDLQVLSETRQIAIHARQLQTYTATIGEQNSAIQYPLKITHNEKLEFLILEPEDSNLILRVNTNWTLTIQYTGNLRTDNGGFYLSTYTDNNGSTRYLAATHFESTNARHAFPCYDEPAKRAEFSITIKHSPTYTAISNMPIDDSKTNVGVTAFQRTPKMSTYLIAFIVSEFVSSNGTLNGMQQRVFSRQITSSNQYWALTSGMLLEKRLSSYYDVPFALPKLDQAAIPDFAAGAMENWGLATYREEYLLYNEENSTINTQTNIATIVAHEYTHMWFGNLVAVEWWTYLWLKEGFATLFEHLAVDLTYPEWDIFQLFHVGSLQSALNFDGTTATRPMTYYVHSPEDIALLYDQIPYAKSGSVLDMWRHALTNKVFQRGLHNYLETNKFSATNEDHLFNAIQLAAKELNYALPDTIRNMMSSWSRQAGVPLLTVKRHYTNGSFTVEQQTFLNNETTKQEKYWYVPINYALQSNPDFRNTEATHYLLKNSSITINNNIPANDWLILNKQSTGYYRINYDQHNWELIIEGLATSPHKIHPRNRAQLINDAYRFTTLNRLSHNTLLVLLTYLPNEDQYAPWASANEVLNIFNRYLSSNDGYDNFKYYIKQLVSTQFDRFGTNDVHGEQHLSKYTRNVLINLACLAGVESCLQETNAKMRAFIDNNTIIEPNLQAQTYCNGLKESSNADYNFILNKMLNSNEQAERRLLISSLGCSQSATQLMQFISSSIDVSQPLRSQERYTLLAPAYSRSEVGLLTCIEFLNENWEAYGKLNPGFDGLNPLYADVVNMAAYVVNDNQEQKYLALVNMVKNSQYVGSDLQTLAEATVQANKNWLNQNREPIMTWLTNFHKNSSGNLMASLSTLAITLFIVLTRLY